MVVELTTWPSISQQHLRLAWLGGGSFLESLVAGLPFATGRRAHRAASVRLLMNPIYFRLNSLATNKRNINVMNKISYIVGGSCFLATQMGCLINSMAEKDVKALLSKLLP